jgi:hypothetical protein
LRPLRHDQYDAAGRLDANEASNRLRRRGVLVRAVTNQDGCRDELRTCQREGDDESAGLEDAAPIDVLSEAFDGGPICGFAIKAAAT